MQKKILDKYLITNPYIYYPAQFWAHKNHSYILYAIKDLQERFDTKINVVFSGSDKGNLKYILDLAKELKISKSVNYLGFVESNEIPILYKNSIALVMPSYFGPTNIPPLEALTLSIPIIYADINGAREQLGNAAIFVNLWPLIPSGNFFNNWLSIIMFFPIGFYIFSIKINNLRKRIRD